MAGMYPLVEATIRRCGTDIQVLVFPNGIVVSMNPVLLCGDHLVASQDQITRITGRLVSLTTDQPKSSA